VSDILVLIGGDGPEAPIAWTRVGEDGAVRERGVSGPNPPAFAPSRTVLVLPGADARVKRLDLPARSEAQARAGAPYLFERSLAGREDLHYAVGAPQDDAGGRLTAAIASSRLGAWLERCRSLGADPHIVVLDCTILPIAAREIAIVAAPERVIVSAGALGGFSIEPSLAPALLPGWLAETHAGEARISLYGGDPAVYRASLGAAGGRLEAQGEIDPIAALARGAADVSDIVPNLRQGAFAAATRREGKPLRHWRFAALLAAAAVLLQIGAMTIAGVRDRQAAAQIMAGAERDLLTARPDVGRIVNLRAQVRALVNAMDQADDHPVLAVNPPVIEALRQQPLARLDEVRHQAPDTRVTMVISAPQTPVLEAAIAALRAQTVTIEAGALGTQSGRAVAEIAVEKTP